MRTTKSYLKDLTYPTIGCAIEVHKALGPGLLEIIYHQCIQKELEIRGIAFASELRVPVEYKGTKIENNLRCDLLVEDLLVVELKSVDTLLSIHKAQLLTYMKLNEVGVEFETFKKSWDKTNRSYPSLRLFTRRIQVTPSTTI